MLTSGGLPSKPRDSLYVFKADPDKPDIKRQEPRILYPEKTIEGYLDSVRSLTSNTIKTLLTRIIFLRKNRCLPLLMSKE